jgi:hypothetical protein
VEIMPGKFFRVEVDGVLQVRRMEYAHEGRGCYAFRGPEQGNGMRAAIGSGE